MTQYAMRVLVLKHSKSFLTTKVASGFKGTRRMAILLRTAAVSTSVYLLHVPVITLLLPTMQAKTAVVLQTSLPF